MGEIYREGGMQDMDENKIDLFDLMGKMLKRFRETWWIFLLLAVAVSGINLVRVKLTYRPVYEAAASFLVSSGEQGNAVSEYNNKISAAQLSATFPYILTSGALRDVVAEDIGEESVPGVISAQVLGDTNLLQLKVTSDDAQMAYEILQSVIRNYPQVAQYVIGTTNLKMMDESGVPKEPVSGPGYKRQLIISFLIAVLLYAAVLFLHAMTRKTVRSEDDLKRFLNVKYLAGLPKVQFKRRSNSSAMRVSVDNPALPEIYSEAMDSLEIRLERILKEKEMKTLLLTSALAGEGKTTTICNLALLLAQKGNKVLLIDGDLRNPSVAGQLDLGQQKYGLKNILSGEKEAEKVLCRYRDSSLYVIPGGEPVQEVRSLYSNGCLEELLEQYKEKMDFILIDTPPCAMMHDTALIAKYTDAGVLVIRQDYARREKILTSAEILLQSGMILAGCVINGEETGIGSYSYGKYGYGRYGYGKYGYGKYGYGK